jgi:hypothetical protein
MSAARILRNAKLAEMLYTNKLQYFVTTLAANRLWSVEEFRSSRVFLKA